jgi:hypothetical protein
MDRRLPTSVIPGAVVLFVLAIRFSPFFASVTGERQAVAFGLFGPSAGSSWWVHFLVLAKAKLLRHSHT